jgi:hypothetical protein
MIFKYFRDQNYLIIYLMLRKIKSRTPCCLHCVGDGILGCYRLEHKFASIYVPKVSEMI